jgi:putative tricarboxylic transport membrane protein
MTTRRLYQAGGLVIAVGGAALFYASTQMRYATSLGPGPGFFPYWLSALLAVLGVVMIMQATISPPQPLPEDFWPAAGGGRRLVAILAGVALAALGIEPLGFPLTMAAVILLILVALGFRRPLPLAATAFAGSFGVHYVFTRWLSVQLPGGILSL